MRWYLLAAVLLLQGDMCALVVKNSLTHQFALSPGETRESSIQLFNETDDTVKVNLYPSGYSYNAKGETFFPPANTQERSNANWIQLPIDHVVIPPQGHVDVLYSVQAPQDRTLNGSYWSLILVEPDTVTAQPVNENCPDFQITVKVRYACQIVTDMGKGKSSLKIIGKTVEKTPNGYVLHVDLENNGTQFLMPKLTLQLHDAAGKQMKTLTKNPDKILPGTSIRFTIDLGVINEKKILGFLLLDHGDTVLLGHRIDLQLPE